METPTGRAQPRHLLLGCNPPPWRGVIGTHPPPPRRVLLLHLSPSSPSSALPALPLVRALRVCAYYLSWRPAACVRAPCVRVLSLLAAGCLCARPCVRVLPLLAGELRSSFKGGAWAPAVPGATIHPPHASWACAACQQAALAARGAGQALAGARPSWRLLVVRSLSGWSALRSRLRACHIGRALVSSSRSAAWWSSTATLVGCCRPVRLPQDSPPEGLGERQRQCSWAWGFYANRLSPAHRYTTRRGGWGLLGGLSSRRVSWSFRPAV